MQVQGLGFTLPQNYQRPSVAAGGPPEPRELLSLSGQMDKKKVGTAMGWTGFAIQCVGAGITLATNSWGGVALFAAGAALLVAGEIVKRQG